jgi:hypothetical protein
MTKIRVKLFKEISFNYYMTDLEFYAKGLIIGKRIKLDSKDFNESQREYYRPFIGYNFQFIDINKDEFNKKVNVLISTRMISCYCYLNYVKRLKLKYIYRHLWIQQPENIKWIVTAFFAGIGSFLALITYVFKCF